MKKPLLIILFLGLVAGGLYWWLSRNAQPEKEELLLYGNLDLRQVNLAFNGNERIQTLLVHEGDRVSRGQILGTLEMERLQGSVAQAEARVEAQRQVVRRLEAGTRLEEIDQTRANLNAAQTDLNNARRTYERLQRSASTGASSRQDLDNAQAALEVSEARLRVQQKALDLAVIGPRKEEIAEARATLRANEAGLAVLRQDLSYATLLCPTNGVIQNRMLEPGDMASPQRPVLSIAITDPKWVRAYVPEPDLGKIRVGMNAAVSTDSFPGKNYEGWVGFISPVASFTPKSVETTDLRTSLVYETRIFAKDPADELRLGMPATVRIPLRQETSSKEGGS